MGFPRQDSQGRAASTGPETVLSLDSVVQLQEFTLRRNKVEQATHQAGHCISEPQGMVGQEAWTVPLQWLKGTHFI